MAELKGNHKKMIRFRKVLDAFHETIASSPYGFKGMANELGKGLSQLYDECNSAPAKTSAGKLGVDDAIEIMRLSEDITPLHVMAAELNCRVRPLSALPDAGSPLQQFVDLDEAVTNFKSAVASQQPYDSIVLAMARVADAAETICALCKAHELGVPVGAVMWGRAMFRKGQ